MVTGVQTCALPIFTFTGGVSQNEGMVHALRRRLGAPVNVSPLSQYLGALGAALHGRERLAGGAS